MKTATLISNPINVFYLSKLQSSNAHILMIHDQHYLCTDGRYIEEAQKLADKFEVILIDQKWPQPLFDICKQHKIKKILVETDYFTVDRYQGWEKAAQKHKISLASIKPKDRLVETRSYKTTAEAEIIKKAQQITEKAICKAYALCHEGVTEAALAWKIRAIMHDLGADEMSFDPIVAFGNNSAIPHHHSGNTQWKETDIVLIDAGAKYKHYCGDMTRTFLPKNPSAEMYNAYEAVNRAKKAGEQVAKELHHHEPLAKIATTIRASLKKDQLEQYFTHSTGHGVGLEIHELPNISPKTKATKQPGQIFTIEPGVYIPGKFGIRIEDIMFF